MADRPLQELKLSGLRIRPAPDHPGLLVSRWGRGLARHIFGVRIWAGRPGQALYATSLGWRQAEQGEAAGAPVDELTWSFIERARLIMVLERLVRRAPRWPWTALYCVLIAWLYRASVDHPLSLAQLLAWLLLTAAFAALHAWHDGLCSRMALFYELDASLKSHMEALVRGARMASDVRRLSVQANTDGLTVHPACLTVGAPPHLCVNLEVPLLRTDTRVLAFLPDQILDFSAGRARSIAYAELQVRVSRLTVTEAGLVPFDARRLDDACQGVGKPEALCAFGALTLSTPDGWELRLASSREHALVGFGRALRAMGRA